MSFEDRQPRVIATVKRNNGHEIRVQIPTTGDRDVVSIREFARRGVGSGRAWHALSAGIHVKPDSLVDLIRALEKAAIEIATVD